jgi:hypothetical protein
MLRAKRKRRFSDPAKGKVTDISGLGDRKGAAEAAGTVKCHQRPVRRSIAANDHARVVTLVRRDGERVPELLQRPDEAIGKALHQGTVTNEINGR